MDKIKVFVKLPGGVPVLQEIDNTLERLQEIVGGYIEAVTLAEDFVIVCHEEGRLRGLAPNCTICGAAGIAGV